MVNCGYKSESSSKDIDATLTPLIEDIMQAFDLPGFAIGVVKDNEVVYARGFGYKNIDTKKPVTTTTLFHMASISKPFVATAVMQLVKQERSTWRRLSPPICLISNSMTNGTQI